ncbi:MAG: MATE family efflux transporter [Lachnospiraceae bacterium]|nr:MATE family efflux transporter [Lachnospiraceae bacterium]
MLTKKEFVGHALKLALPIMIQNLIGTLVQAADTIMLGYVSQEAMAAASLANQYAFVLLCFNYGMSTASSVLCAQYFGRKDMKTIERVLGLATRLSLVISLAFFLLGVLVPEGIMRLLSSSPETIRLGSEYIRWVSISYVFTGISSVYVSALRSVRKVVLPSVIYAVSLAVNVIMNAVFIFGLLGAPKLGVVGVAIGTVIARAVELLICLVYSTLGKSIRIRVRYIFTKAGVLLKDFLKIGVPAVMNDIVWSLATTVFAAILGHIGDDMVAANAVAMTVVNVGAISSRGFANATTIVISNTLGENDIPAAKVYARRMLIMTLVVALAGCGVILALRPFIMSYYADKLSAVAVRYLGSILIMTTWRLVGEGLNTAWICGCFRGGGDARFGMIVDTVFMWGVAVPLMALAAYVLKLPPLGVYLVMSLDEMYKMPAVFIHYRKFNWLNNITRDMESAENQ